MISMIFKLVNISIGLILVPILIDYLNPTKYGIWITIGSVIEWLIIFDVGLSNGLKNRLSESFALKDLNLAKEYLSTTYALLIVFMSVIYCIYILLLPFINWETLLNVKNDEIPELDSTIFATFTFFILRFILNILGIVFTASQSPSKNSIIESIGNLLALITIIIITRWSSENLFLVSLAIGAAPVIVLIISSIYAYGDRFKTIRPSIQKIDFSKIKDLASLSLKFFIIQIAVIIIFTSDNILITRLLGPEQVTPYNVTLKYFGLVTILFSIIITPFWAAFNEAYLNSDLKWIKTSIKKLIVFWILLVIIASLMFMVSKDLIGYWVGEQIEIPWRLSFGMLLFAIISTWNNIYAHFLNGIGKIQLQLYYSLFALIINIPISILLVKYFKMGSSGIIFGTCISLSLGAIFSPLQYYRIINNKAKGIWNK